MKTKLQLFLLFLVLVSISNISLAQTWTSQTIPSSSTVRAIHFIDANNGWAAGYDGVIYHTTSGGSNWASQSSNVTERLVAIRFVDANYGWANAGLRVVRTENGGTDWTSMSGLDANAGIFRNTIFPVSSTVAWSTAQGGGLRWFYRYTATSSSAVTEQTFNLISSSAQLLDLWFVDTDNGWAVGTSGQIWKITSASGDTPSFTNQTNSSVTTSNLRAIYMLNATDGWAVGDGGTIIKTTDGGTNWSTVSSGTSTGLRDVHLLDMNNAIVVGDGGVIRSTTDGGSNWTSHTSGVSTYLFSVVFIDANTGFVAGGDLATSSSGAILSVSSFSLPVELTSFTADAKGNTVELTWNTATEINNYGFEIERKSNNESWNKIGFVKGAGNSNSPKSYSFTDKNAASGSYLYRLKQIDIDGIYKYSNEIEATVTGAGEFVLKQNYPNPFNPVTKINYSIAGKDLVNLAVYDILGRQVSTLVNSVQDAGTYEIEFDGSKLPSGVYIYRIQSNGFSDSKKLIIMK